jgi:hypothetical protein
MWIKIKIYLANSKLPDLHKRYGTSKTSCKFLVLLLLSSPHL